MVETGGARPPYARQKWRFVDSDSEPGVEVCVAATIDCTVAPKEFTVTDDVSSATAGVGVFEQLPTAIAGMTNLAEGPGRGL